MIPDFIAVIPARYDSTRLQGKPLAEIGGAPLIQYVYEAAVQSRATKVLIATDDERIEKAAGKFTENIIITSNLHRSGTDRVAQAAALSGLQDKDMIVNVQGDAFNLPPALINQVAENLQKNKPAAMATLCERIQTREEIHNPDLVKVIFDAQGHALLFSRSPIPWQETINDHTVPAPAHKHIGLYAYRYGFLKTYTHLPRCALEETERLEQLRALYHGYKIHVAPALEKTGIEINTADDLERARALFDLGSG